MSINNEAFGFIPIGTKIYLKNRELVEIENLKFGDEILSVNLLGEDIESSAEIYFKYCNNNKIKINPEQLQISSSYITDIRHYGQYNHKIISLSDIDNNVSLVHESQLFLTVNTLVQGKGDALVEDEKIVKIKTVNTLNINNEPELEYFVSLEKDIKTDTEDFFVFDKQIKSASLTTSKAPLFSMSLSNGNFYVTENMILLGKNT